jgi:formylglycine-generating enzyme required for sulfatase activity/dienelactone hydrolase
MEYLEGESLAERLTKGPLPLAEAIRCATQIAEALAEAHQQGVVHRDLKPANVVLTKKGAKLLDFGIAKLRAGAVSEEAPTATASELTGEGVLVGTPQYMAPEQLEGKPVDARTDVFAFGLVLYEMLTGQKAFTASSRAALISDILNRQPRPVSAGGLVPAALDPIVQRCLEKEPSKRFPSAEEAALALEAVAEEVSGRPSRVRPRLRTRAAILVAAFAVALVGALGWAALRAYRQSWASRVALPELARLSDRGELWPAFLLARKVERYLPGDPRLEPFWRNYSRTVSIRTTPPDADVYLREYSAAGGDWEYVGRSPIQSLRVPARNTRVRILKTGFEPFEALFWVPPPVVLTPEGSPEAGMVHVPAGEYHLGGSLPEVKLGGYWIDKYEVTNRQYKEFVDRGGYRNQAYWKQPFVKDGVRLTWDEAMAAFRDATGRPGPATWELGSYPEGRADFPVGGVSWYEASAYAEFAGKSLPTAYHWYAAAFAQGFPASMLPLSNFGSRGAERVGTHAAASPYGVCDMAGNVKEWTVNPTGDERRNLLGGAWTDPAYLFVLTDARSPFDRSETHGFRCVRYLEAPIEALSGPLPNLFRDFSKEKPASEETFRAYKRMYSYDRTALNPRTESVAEAEHWRRETVSFDAAYDGERVIAHLFLPRGARPPYQTVIYFPSLAALDMTSSGSLEMQAVEFLTRGGRAVLYPLYKGTYERRSGPHPPWGSSADRDRTIQWAKDFSRSIDYLQTRPDIDREKLAFYGFSMGAIYGPLVAAVDGRLKATVLVAGGLPAHGISCCFRPLPEADTFNFAPRDRTPTLMINARGDVITPVETSQLPLFRLLGAPAEDKRYALYDGTHVPTRFQDVIRETLDWLDRYLGPVAVSG